MSTQPLTSTEAAARLGVKRETLYAYVSRGLLHRSVSLDGRTSLFDPEEVDALRSNRRRPARGEVTTVITSAICELDEAGHKYRGQLVSELVAGQTLFEDVADLLWQSTAGWVPDPVSPALVDAQRGMDASSPLLDRMRVSVAYLSGSDTFRGDLSQPWMALAGRRIIGAMVDGLPDLGRPNGNRLADRFWVKLTKQRGNAAQRDAMNAALVLLADHGLAASTFAVRVAASVRADPYSLVQTGLGAMGGPLHGAAGGDVHRFFEKAVDQGAAATVAASLSAGQLIPGFGHAVYRSVDPREQILFQLLEAAFPGDPKFSVVQDVRRISRDRINKPANIDFAVGALTWLAGMSPSGGELFAVARTAGWLAHAMEEFTEKPMRYRLQARSTGPRPVLPEDS